MELALKSVVRDLPGYGSLYRVKQLSPLVRFGFHHPALAWQFYRAHRNIPVAHSHAEAVAVVQSILALDPAVPGVIVEAGCFKGGSTAKFSLAAQRMGRTLVVFDSFQGLPNSTEDLERFAPGKYAGALREVLFNVDHFGHISSCRFIPGWFKHTMPTFKEPIALAYLDCDHEESTTTCLQYLWPLIQPGGVLFSQDGHIDRVLRVIENELPPYERLGRKLLRVVKH